MPRVSIKNISSAYKLVPKEFKNISGANYEINTFNFKLPTTIGNPTVPDVDNFKYETVKNTVTSNRRTEYDYYNKLPYYVNIVDHNNISITGEAVNDMDEMKPNNMFGVLFYDKPLMVKPLFVFSGPDNMPLYGTGGGYFSMNNMFTAVVYNGIGTTRLYMNDQRVGLFLNKTRYNDSTKNNTDNYSNTRVERITYMPIDTNTDPDNPTLNFTPTYGTKPFVEVFNTDDKTYIDTLAKEEVWKYPVYEYGIQTGEVEYYNSMDSLVSQPGEDPSRFIERNMSDTNTAQYIETNEESVSLVVKDDYSEADEVGLNLNYSNNIGDLFFFGRDKDAIKVASNAMDENVIPTHYLFYYKKRPQLNPDPNYYYYPYPTDTNDGDVQLDDLYKLMNTKITDLNALAPSSNNNFLGRVSGTNKIYHDYLSYEKLKFFVLSVYTVDGHQTRTISPVLSTEMIHATGNYYQIMKTIDDNYIKNAARTSDYVYLVPQFGYKIDVEELEEGGHDITDETINYNYGRRIMVGMAQYTDPSSGKVYYFGVDNSGCFILNGLTKQYCDAEIQMSVCNFSAYNHTFGLRYLGPIGMAWLRHFVYYDGTATTIMTNIGEGTFNIADKMYGMSYVGDTPSYIVWSNESDIQQVYYRNVYVFNVDGKTFFVNNPDENTFEVNYYGRLSTIRVINTNDQIYGKFDISDLDYLENYDFEFGRLDITEPNPENPITPTYPNTYYQFIAKDHKTIENSILKNGDGDYKITAIVSVDHASANSAYVCNVSRAIKIRVSNFLDMNETISLYVTDAAKTKHVTTNDVNAAIYDLSDGFPELEGCTKQEFDNFVATHQSLFKKIYNQIKPD